MREENKAFVCAGHIGNPKDLGKLLEIEPTTKQIQIGIERFYRRYGAD